MRKLIIASFIALSMVGPRAYAQTTTPTSDQLRIQLIQVLTQLIAQLQAQIQQILVAQKVAIVTSMQATTQPNQSITAPQVLEVTETKTPLVAPLVMKNGELYDPNPRCTLIAETVASSSDEYGRPMIKVTWTSEALTSGTLTSYDLSGQRTIQLNPVEGGSIGGFKLTIYPRAEASFRAEFMGAKNLDHSVICGTSLPQ